MEIDYTYRYEYLNGIVEDFIKHGDVSIVSDDRVLFEVDNISFALPAKYVTQLMFDRFIVEFAFTEFGNYEYSVSLDEVKELLGL